MRILVLQESDWVDRGPHQSHHLFERLRQRGHEVRVIDFEIGWRSRPGTSIAGARKEFIAPAKIIEGATIQVVRPGSIRLAYLDYASVLANHSIEIRRQLREFHPDIVVGLGILNAFSGVRQARKVGIPFAYYLIDELHRLVPEPLFRGIARVVEQSNVRRASMVLSINQQLRDYTIAMGARSEMAKVLPAGVDMGWIAVGNGAKVRERHSIGTGDLVLFFMGWLYPFSGLREVVERLLAEERHTSRLRLLVVGKGDSWAEVSRLVQAKGASDLVTMVDFRPYAEMPSYLASADICLLPALQVEAMRNIVPIKMYEYLAAGKPVIATRLPGLVREFGEGNGVVYVDQPGEAVDKALELASQGKLPELGEAARKFVAGNDWKTITDKFECLLTELVAQARRAASAGNHLTHDVQNDAHENRKASEDHGDGNEE